MAAKRRKKLIPALLLLLVIIAVAAVAIIFISSRGKKDIGKSIIQMPFSRSSKYCFAQSGIVYTQGTQLHYIDFTDEEKSTVEQFAQLATADCNIAASSKMRVAYNATSMQIVGTDFPIEFTGEVLSVKCGGDYAALLKTENEQKSILIYDKKGEQTDRFDYVDTTLQDYGFYTSESGDSMWTITVDTSAKSPVSTITLYEIARKATTGLVTVQSQLIENVAITDESIFVMCTNNVIRYKRQGNTESYRLLTYGFKGVDWSAGGKQPLILLYEREAEDNALARLLTCEEGDVSEEKLVTKQLPEDTTGAFCAGGYLYCTASNKIYKFSSTGKLISSYSVDFGITGADKLNEKYILLESGETMYLLNLEN